MNIEDFRNFCLSLPDVTEGTPFEKFAKDKFTILVFYVRRHMFCYFNIDDFTSITVKCNPGDIVELKERYQAIGAPYNGNPKYWIGVELHSDVSDDQVLSLVLDSYRMVRGSK
ncbi:MAG: MmcQ/YjbR family DNA-binding protein [Muribaculaceae bacterium]|nr:MmcQ/YjbR family DNA-binding protein [Muribaculaceae bacterium]